MKGNSNIMEGIKRQQMNMIPVPKKVLGTDERVEIQPYIQCDVEEWKELISVFQFCMNKIHNLTYQEGVGGISILYEKDIEKEAYRICVDNEVKVYAADYEGAAYGVASLVQLIDKNRSICKVGIEDWPDKDYRGLMVDIARKWHPFYSLLHYVDVCFSFKIKYLHLHFADDQSYTLPSKSFPKLAVNGRSYTEEEIRLLCNYAKSRGVILVPEIEMPGHARILNQAYPEIFSDTLLTEDYERAATENGTVLDAQSIICAGNPNTIQAVKTLIDEVLELFPTSPYIHLGADEANYRVWEHCQHCRQYMKEHKLHNAKELYAEFLGRVTNYVLEKGRTPIIWEGFADEHSHFISKDVLVIGWENHYQTVDNLLKNGFKIINCAWKPLYVVGGIFEHERYHFEDIMRWNMYEWQHWWEGSEAALNPIHVAPTDQVLGAQLCVWGLNYEREICRAVENLAALSERVWSEKRICDNKEFQNRMCHVLEGVYQLIAEE